MAKAKKTDREIVYPKFEAVWHVADKTLANGKARPPVTEEVAKELLGWEEEPDTKPGFGNDYLFKDRRGKKIRCHNDVRNRPIYWSSVEAYIQDILRNRWMVNGETIIIGKTGIILNGQHQLISVVLAEQDRLKQEAFWGENWAGPVYIEKLVAFGVDEEDEVVNTMDTCKPRSLSDVIYRSPYFAKLKEDARRTAARMTDHAVRQMWYRTGIYVASQESFSIRRTHSEAISFINNHPELLKCIKHILEENKDGQIQKFVGPGYASAMLYLMAVSTSHPDDYYGPEERSEKSLEWKNWDKALGFWSDFAAHDNLEALRKAFVKLSEQEDGGNLREKDYLICKAWKAYLTGTKVTAKDLTIEYSPLDDKGRRYLLNAPDLGGIDLGISRDHTPPVETEPSDVEVEEVETAKEVVKNGKDKHDDDDAVDWKWLDKLHTDNPDVAVILARSPLGNWQAWGEDGELAAKTLGTVTKADPRLRRVLTVKPDKIDDTIRDLTKDGLTVGLAIEEDEGWKMQTLNPPSVNGAPSKKAKKGAKK